MKKHITSNRAFTLIELLMVIAIIGILAGILIPAVGAVKKQAKIAASKAQLSGYVNAIQQFKGEYGYYPFVSGTTEEFSLDGVANSTEFIQTLSGRNPDGSPISPADARDTGNRRKIGFYSFSEQEFYFDGNEYVEDQLADRFNSTEIVIVIDADGDGFVSPRPDSFTAPDEIRSPVTAYVERTDLGPEYHLWDN